MTDGWFWECQCRDWDTFVGPLVFSKYVSVYCNASLLMEAQSSFATLLARYSSDDVTLGTDKATRRSYGVLYEHVLMCLQDRLHVTVLEIGTGCGAFAEVVALTLPTAHVLAVDTTLVNVRYARGNPRVFMYERDATKTETAQELNSFYDLVVDNASHTAKDQLESLDVFAPYLKPGGMYVLEDIADASMQSPIQALATKHDLTLIWGDLRAIRGRPNDVVAILTRNNYNFAVNRHNVVLSVASASPSPPSSSLSLPSLPTSSSLFLPSSNGKLPSIYVAGVVNGGLGNCMFQVAAAAALWDSAKYNAIYLDTSSFSLRYGTGVMADRKRLRTKPDGAYETYLDNIFSSPLLRQVSDLPRDTTDVTGTYAGTYEPEPATVAGDIVIRGFCQHRDFVLRNPANVLRAFNCGDVRRRDYVAARYPLHAFSTVVMVGVRACDDFKHMNKVNYAALSAALGIALQHKHAAECAVLALVDKPGINVLDWVAIPPGVALFVVDDAEDDVTQMYAGLQCDTFILGESTFHYWVALMKYLQEPQTTKVLFFTDTDVSNRNLDMPGWTSLPLSF